MVDAVKVVTPDDLGDTLKLGAKVANKYDVDVSKFDLPNGITDASLTGTVLTITTDEKSITVDLSGILPKRDVRLTNASGETELGYLYSTSGEA